MKAIGCLVLFTVLARGQAPLEVEMKAAIHKEQVEGDLRGAIAAYQKIAARAGAERDIAARALYQLGLCQERLGQAEARRSFERVVKEFGTQPVAAQARARLAALQGGASEARLRLVWDNAVDLWGTVSADGRYLSFVDWETGDVAVRDLRAGTNHRVTDHGGYSKAKAEAAGNVISPDGKRIAFTWERYDEKSKRERTTIELRVIGADGSGEKLLMQVKGWVEPHGWSPDGKWLVAVYQEPAFVETEILVVSAEDGSSRKLAIGGKGMKQRVSFSPDGQWLAYSSEGILYTVRSDGSAAAEARVALDALMLAWTPDGRGILFARKQDGANRLFLVPVEQGKPSGEPRMIRAEALPESGSLGITAAGTLLLGAPNRKAEVWISEFNSGTGQLGRRLRALPAEPIGPAWLNGSVKFSPDGKELLYRSRGQALRIHEVATGTERTVVPQLKTTRLAHWSPDGAALLASGIGNDGKDGLFRLDPWTGAAQFLAARPPETRILSGTDGSAMIYEGRAGVVRRDTKSNDEKVLWEADPTLGQVGEAAFSRDGKHVAVRTINYVGTVDLAKGETKRLFFGVIAELRKGIWGVQWSPDGGSVLALINGVGLKDRSEVAVLPLDGGAERQSTAPAHLRGFSVSPDGKMAAVLSHTNRYQVLALENVVPARQQ